MAYIQRSAIVTATVVDGIRTADLSLTGTLTGNSILVGISQFGSAIRTFTVADSVNGSHTSVVAYNPARAARIFEVREGLGGNLTITVSAEDNEGAFDAVALEVAGLDSEASAITGSNVTTSGLSFPCASSGLDTTSGAFFFSVSALNGSTSGRTANASVDEGFVGNSSERFFQRWDAVTAQTGVTATWTHTGTNRIATSCLAAFPYAGASGGATRRMWTAIL
jgi:hypothetical protein